MAGVFGSRGREPDLKEKGDYGEGEGDGNANVCFQGFHRSKGTDLQLSLGLLRRHEAVPLYVVQCKCLGGRQQKVHQDIDSTDPIK